MGLWWPVVAAVAAVVAVVVVEVVAAGRVPLGERMPMCRLLLVVVVVVVVAVGLLHRPLLWSIQDPPPPTKAPTSPR